MYGTVVSFIASLAFSGDTDYFILPYFKLLLEPFNGTKIEFPHRKVSDKKKVRVGILDVPNQPKHYLKYKIRPHKKHADPS